MATKSTMKNMAVCLTAVCLVCSALLAAVYAITLDPIKEAADKALKESVGKVLPQGGQLSEAATLEVDGAQYEYYTLTQDGQAVAYAVKSTVVGFGGPLTVMVGVLTDGTVYNTSVLEHSETPGLGAKCQSDESFLSQFRGFKGALKVRKDGGDIDAITASTITSRAYALAVAGAVNAVGRISNE